MGLSVRQSLKSGGTLNPLQKENWKSQFQEFPSRELRRKRTSGWLPSWREVIELCCRCCFSHPLDYQLPIRNFAFAIQSDKESFPLPESTWSMNGLILNTNFLYHGKMTFYGELRGSCWQHCRQSLSNWNRFYGGRYSIYSARNYQRKRFCNFPVASKSEAKVLRRFASSRSRKRFRLCGFAMTS